MNDPSTADFWTLNHLWLLIVTAGGAILAFFTKRIIDDIDGKADKETVRELRDSVQALVARDDERHRSNTTRLDDIYRILVNRGPQ